jgi:hypothetical protein
MQSGRRSAGTRSGGWDFHFQDANGSWLNLWTRVTVPKLTLPGAGAVNVAIPLNAKTVWGRSVDCVDSTGAPTNGCTTVVSFG